MGCWGLVVYAATAAVCSGKPTSLHSFSFFFFFFKTPAFSSDVLEHWFSNIYLPVSLFTFLISAILQKYLDNFDLSIKVIYIVGTLGFSVGQLLWQNNYQPIVKLLPADLMPVALCIFLSKELLSWLSFPMFTLPWLWSAAWVWSRWVSPTVPMHYWDSTMKSKRFVQTHPHLSFSAVEHPEKLKMHHLLTVFEVKKTTRN